VSMEFSKIIVDWSERSRSLFEVDRWISGDAWMCENLQSEQSIDLHNGFLSHLTEIETIVSKRTETSKSKSIDEWVKWLFENTISPFPQTGDDASKMYAAFSVQTAPPVEWIAYSLSLRN
jgi:hypothetical protein